MTNQISSEALSLLYDNNQLFYVSNRDKNKSGAKVEEPNIDYKKRHVQARLAETVFVISKRTSDLSNPTLQTFFSNFRNSISRDDNNSSILIIEENADNTFEDLVSDAAVKYIVYWGVEVLLPKSLSKYEPLSQKGKAILLVDTMEAVEKDKELKMKLWKTVRQMFK